MGDSRRGGTETTKKKVRKLGRLGAGSVENSLEGNGKWGELGGAISNSGKITGSRA